MTGISAMKCLL